MDNLPSADGGNWNALTIATWETWRFGRYTLAKVCFDGPWTLKCSGSPIWSGQSLQAGMAFAAAHAQPNPPASIEGRE